MQKPSQLSAVMCVLLLAASGTALSDDHPHVQAWAIDYYQHNTACTVASIESVDRKPGKVTVMLEVEAATAKALLKNTSNVRDRWLALHCPPEIHPAWRFNQRKFDVSIVARLDGINQYVLSCAGHYQQIQLARKQTGSSALQRLKELFNER